MRKMNLLAACLAVALAACTATPPATPNLQAIPTALPTAMPTSAPVQMAQRTADARQAQALVMAYNDIFWIMGVGTMIVLPLVLFLRPLPKDAAPAAMH